MTTASPNKRRSGTVVVFTLLMMIGMLAFVALAVDIGYLSVAQSELRRSADAAAIAGANELVNKVSQVRLGAPSFSLESVRAATGQFAGFNRVASDAPALASADTAIGWLTYPFHPDAGFDVSDPSRFNAVSVRVRRTTDQNGEVNLFFAKALGVNSKAMEAEAVAVFLNNIGGFQTPPEGETLDILPFALDKTTWDNLLAGGGNDLYKWDKDTKTVSSGCGDGVREVNLYPQGTGSPGNRGTVDIGPANNSTSDICRQIRNGISRSDMEALTASGRSLEFDDTGKLYLNGDTGISAGVKDDLASIIGQTRIIPIFASVSGNGNNAEYTITAWAEVRVMYVKLTGSPSSKKLIVQPANVVAKYGVPSPGETPTSYSVFSAPWLIR